MADMQVDNSVIDELDSEKKVDVFVRHYKKTKKQLSKKDTWEDDGPAEIKKLSEALQLGAYTIFALNEIAEFRSKSSWEKLEKSLNKFEDILVAICENNDKNQNAMCGLIEMCIEDNKKKLMPYAANIFKKLYDSDILSDTNILAWSKKPTKKYTSKKFMQKIVDNENMKKLLEWLEEDDSSSTSGSDEESSDEEEEENEAVQEKKKNKEEENEQEKQTENTENAAKKSSEPAAAAWSDDDDEDIDIDNI